VGIAQGSEGAHPIVTISFESSDDACDGESDVVAGWMASTGVIGRYSTFKRVYVTGTGLLPLQAAGSLLFVVRSALVDLRWRRWGSPRAVARGKVGFNSCVPNCARARPAYQPVWALIIRRRTCFGHVQSRVLRFRRTSSARPQGLAGTYRETFSLLLASMRVLRRG
jgi:hypothetical protein